MKLPPEQAYARIAEQMRAAADRIQDAPAASEIGRLDAPYSDAVILPSWSIGAAMWTAHDALDTLAFLIGAQNAPAHPRAHAALIREVLTGALTPLAVLAPATEDARDDAARLLLTVDTQSYKIAMSAGAATQGPEMDNVRGMARDAAPRIEATLEQHPYRLPKGRRPSSAMLIDRGIDVFASLMANNLTPELRSGEGLRAHLAPNLSSNAKWSWNTTSGLVHGFYWPQEALGEGDIEGLMPAVCRAAELASALAVDASSLSAPDYQATLAAYHPR